MHFCHQAYSHISTHHTGKDDTMHVNHYKQPWPPTSIRMQHLQPNTSWQYNIHVGCINSKLYAYLVEAIPRLNLTKYIHMECVKNLTIINRYNLPILMKMQWRLPIILSAFHLLTHACMYTWPGYSNSLRQLDSMYIQCRETSSDLNWFRLYIP